MPNKSLLSFSIFTLLLFFVFVLYFSLSFFTSPTLLRNNTARSHPKPPTINNSKPANIICDETPTIPSKHALHSETSNFPADIDAPFTQNRSTLAPLFGRVLIHNSRIPIHGAHVAAYTSYISDSHPINIATTDMSGRFSFCDWTAIPLFIRVTPIGFEERIFRYSSEHSSQSEEITVQVRPEAIVSGSIRNSNGLPIPHLLIHVTRCGQIGTSATSGIPTQWTSETNDNGEFRIEHLWPDVALSLQVNSEKFRCILSGELTPLYTVSFILKPKEDLHFDILLPHGSTIIGKVTDEHFSPLRRAKVCLTVRPLAPTSKATFSGLLATTITDSNGNYRIEYAPGGRWHIGVTDYYGNYSDGKPNHEKISISSVPIAVASDSDIVRKDLVVYRDLWISGYVFDYLGQRVTSASVECVPVFVEDVSEPLCCTTGLYGRFRIGPLVPGNYSVIARPDLDARHRASCSKAVSAVAGDIELNIRLRKRLSATYRLLLPNNTSNYRWNSWAFERETGSMWTATGDSDVVHFESLPPGVYDFVSVIDNRCAGTLDNVYIDSIQTSELGSMDCRKLGGWINVAISGIRSILDRNLVFEVWGVNGSKIYSAAVDGTPFRVFVPSGSRRVVLRTEGNIVSERYVTVLSGRVTSASFD